MSAIKANKAARRNAEVTRQLRAEAGLRHCRALSLPVPRPGAASGVTGLLLRQCADEIRQALTEALPGRVRFYGQRYRLQVAGLHLAVRVVDDEGDEMAAAVLHLGMDPALRG